MTKRRRPGGRTGRRHQSAPPFRTGQPSQAAQALTVQATDASRTPDAPVVVYVHGIGNKPPPAALKRQYDVALFGIDMGARTRLAYWADIRYPQPLPASATDGPAPLA